MATIIDPPNSVWPNGLKVDSEGYVTFYPLGTNKIDINDITWPKGDKVISPFVYQGGKLVGFIDTLALSSPNAPIIVPSNYEVFEGEISPAVPMISSYESGSAHTTINVTYKVKDDEEITYITEDNLGEIQRHFQDNIQQYMVNNDYAPTRIIDNKIYPGEYLMAGAYINTAAIRVGDFLFAYLHKLNQFDSDMSNLVNGYYMFTMCVNLTNFKSILSSLIDGDGMFDYCKLNAESIKNIASTIRDARYDTKIPSMTLGLGIDDTDEARLAFAQELGYSSWVEAENKLIYFPGWGMYIQFNGNPTSTYNLRNTTSLKIYAKIEEIVDENKKRYAKYQSQDENKFYVLHWYHSSNTNNEGYTQFASLEEAVTHFNIKPIERN